jgi:hypothetical protein
MLEAYHQMVINTERNLAKRFGNFERMTKWESTEFFSVARAEWFRAWELLGRRHGLAAVLALRSGKQEMSGEVKAATLALLRLSTPEDTLKRQAAIIHAAACEGDVNFFHRIGLALRSRDRRKPDSAALAWDLLTHWFAGLLWLMNDETGFGALRSYTGKKGLTIDAYRKAVSRLGLKGFPDRTKRPPILNYRPRTRSYVCSKAWTDMEPHLST